MPDLYSPSADSGEPTSPPAKIIQGKYQIEKLIGFGAFAKVYLARNIVSGQTVAIKSIAKEKVLKAGFISHVTREIAIMRRLRHPHIVELFEVLATRSKIHFVMEYVKGGELFAKVANGRLPENLCRRYFQQLISAVRFCHSQGVYHRDLKPENLLLDENGDLKVSDFGLSALSEQIPMDGLFHTLCGTPAYVAPEILTKKGYDAAKVDLWSCGIILFVLNAGYLPFNDANVGAMYRKIYKGVFRCPRWTPREMKNLLYRLLDTNPDTRITVDEIYQDSWFRKGFKELKFHEKGPKEEYQQELNAFDIISFSSSFDLSGLFCDTRVSDRERFLSGEMTERIMERVEELGRREKLEVRRGSGSRVEIKGPNGKFHATVGIYGLTEGLVVVEVGRGGGEVETYDEFCSKKLKPALNVFRYNQQTPFAGGE